MSRLQGTGTLVRLVLRRDRVRLPIWVVAILGLVYFSAGAVQALYDTQAKLDLYAATMGASPAVTVMSGPPTALDTLGGVTVYEINVTVMVAVALMATFLVVRHTRGEEEDGRTELVRSAVVGRHSPTAAALVVVGTATVAVAAGISGVMLAFGLPAEGSLAYGASVAGLGLVFTAVSVCAAQVTAHARGAIGMSAAFLGVAYVLRAFGDLDAPALGWVSPLGWVTAVRPFGEERWWPLLLLVGFAAAMLALAAVLTAHRDVGAGLLPTRPGSPRASRRLGTATGLAARLQRGSAVGWMIGMFVGGVAFGSLSGEVQELIELAPEFGETLTSLGTSAVDTFLGTMLLILALAGAGFTVSSVLRLRSEEASGRLEPLLATGLTRVRWAAGGLLVTVVLTLAVLASGGLGVGVAHAVVQGDPAQAPRLVLASLAYAPATLVLAGVGVLLVGWTPRVATAAWAGLAFCFVIGWLGTVLDFPEVVVQASPFSHVSLVPAQSLDWAPVAILSAFCVALVTVGIAKLANRDIG